VFKDSSHSHVQNHDPLQQTQDDHHQPKSPGLNHNHNHHDHQEEEPVVRIKEDLRGEVLEASSSSSTSSSNEVRPESNGLDLLDVAHKRLTRDESNSVASGDHNYISVSDEESDVVLCLPSTWHTGNGNCNGLRHWSPEQNV